MDQGQIDLIGLRKQLADDDRPAWIRAVVGPEDGGSRHLLFAQVTIGPQPQAWQTSEWEYEQCIFSSGSMPTAEFSQLLRADSTLHLAVGSVNARFDLAATPFPWLRKPSLAQYDERQLPWPTVIYEPSFNQRTLYAPPSFLIGKDDTPTFPVFSAAFGAFFFDDYRVTSTRNPRLGQLSICLVDQRGWISGVDQSSNRLAITLGGDTPSDTVLEFNSSAFRLSLRPSDTGRIIIELPTEVCPPDAWVWLKQGANWLDYRNLQQWGGYVGPDVTVGHNDEHSGNIEPPRRSSTLTNGPATWLRARATEYAKRAMTEYVRLNYHDFFLFAGLAIELALKSRLAEVNLSFLAPDGKFASAIALSGASEDMARLPSGTRTVGGRVALDRFVQLHPSASWLTNGLAELLMHRNGEAHLGVIDPTLQRRTFNSFLQGINTVLEPELEDFWSPHYEFVRATLDENAEQTQHAVTLKISQARERYQHIESLNPEQREAILSIVVVQHSGVSLEESFVACPACGSQAVALGSNEIDYDEPDFDRDGALGGRLRVEFTPESMRCGVCGLTLENPEELFHAGIPVSWENTDEDVIDAYREREAEMWEYADYDPAPEEDSDT